LSVAHIIRLLSISLSKNFLNSEFPQYSGALFITVFFLLNSN